MKRLIPVLIFTAIIAFTSCSKLSSEAKHIVGTYYNTELSQTDPVMTLGKDAKCTVTAIKPGVLTYSVKGTWNVKADSLIMKLDPSTISFEGDSTLIGSIPERIARKVVSYTDFSLMLENNGVSYMYQRRNE